MVGDDGDHRRVEREQNLLWRGRSDKMLRKGVLSRVVREREAAAMDLIHVCADPREVGRGCSFVVEKVILEEGGASRWRRRFI